MVCFGNDWDTVLAGEFLKSEYIGKKYPVYPPMNDIFNALKRTAYKDVKVVIIGQDPYHGPNQAHGLCFSVQKGVDIPPSLKNIYKELSDDIGFIPPSHGCLYDWADNGILLLNSVLTVRGGSPGSHRGKGWEILTDRIISELNRREEPIVFMLWGNYAKEKENWLLPLIITCLRRRIPARFRRITAFLDAGIFQKQASFWGKL